MHIHKHIQAHISGSLRPRLIPTGYAGTVVFIPVQVSWGDSSELTWADGTPVEWSNT